MTPRTASLRVAHQEHCDNRNRSALTSVGRGSGCKCEPSYYTFQRTRDGKPKKGERIKTRSVADKAVRKLQVEIDERRVGQTRPKDLTFGEWADKYEAILEGRVRAGDLKPKTLRGYKETLALARLEFGDVWLRELGQSEARGFLGRIEKQKPASRLRHLRQLSVALTVAVDEDKGYLDKNPVPGFTKKQRLKAPRRGKAPFEDSELERLWTAYRSYEPVYGASARFAAESGLRLGEIVALDWTHVDLSGGRVFVEWGWDEEAGKIPPKDGEARHVYLTKEGRAVLEEWIGVVGAHDEGPVFPNPIGGGRLVARQVQRRIGTAMEDAGVPKQHPDLRKPRSFHSYRYTTSNLMQRRGYHPRLIESNLGHGTLELTYGTYGGWTPDQLAAEATRTP
jgi:integrase